MGWKGGYRFFGWGKGQGHTSTVLTVLAETVVPVTAVLGTARRIIARIAFFHFNIIIVLSIIINDKNG